MTLQLFPQPRSIVEPAGALHPTGPPTIAVDTDLPVQGYRLTIGDGGIHIQHRDDAGLRYARQTLEQMDANAADGVPLMTIEDWPDFVVRCYLLDISRNRVPTRETLQRLVALMDRARLNQLQLYTEHTFAYRDHEEVWRDASPMTSDDVRWLDDLCAAHGIELVANVNVFGHMERWLEHATYRPRAEAPDGFEIAPGVRHDASLLAPTEDNARFALNLLHELLSHIRSRSVNVGADETFELGRGTSRAAVEARGREVVYVEHMKRIIDPLIAEGYQVQFWADIIRGHPELYHEFAGQPIPIAWTYDAVADGAPVFEPQTAELLVNIGVDLGAHTTGFAGNVAPLAEADIPFWVAGGTSAWNSILGRIDNAVVNLVDAVEVGRTHGSEGFMVTDWGDNGSIEPPSISFGPLLFAGAISWGIDANRGLDVADALSRLVFGDATGSLGRAVVALGEVWRIPGGPSFNSSSLHRVLFHRGVGSPVEAIARERVTETVAAIDSGLDLIRTSQPTCADADVVRRELTNAGQLARYAASLLPVTGQQGPSGVAVPAELLADFRECWLLRSRPGGLDRTMALLHPAAERLPTRPFSRSL